MSEGRVPVSVVLLDIDGILTDGRVWIGPDGGETKVITFEDIDAVYRMKRGGLTLGFITGEDTTFCDYVQQRFQPDVLVRGCKDKLGAFQRFAQELGWRAEATCFAGDGFRDVPLLRHVAWSFAPSDAPAEVRAAAREVVSETRGNGVVAAVARRILGEGEEEAP